LALFLQLAAADLFALWSLNITRAIGHPVLGLLWRWRWQQRQLPAALGLAHGPPNDHPLDGIAEPKLCQDATKFNAVVGVGQVC
jgi:hypothetical protein